MEEDVIKTSHLDSMEGVEVNIRRESKNSSNLVWNSDLMRKAFQKYLLCESNSRNIQFLC